MNELLTLVCVGITGLCLIVLLLGRLLRIQSREMLRVVYQADERLSADRCFSEKMIARVLALRYPATHKQFREASGPVIEGAQQRPRQGYFDQPIPEEIRQTHSDAAKLLAEAKQMRESAIGLTRSAEPVDVATQLQFEQNGPA